MPLSPRAPLRISRPWLIVAIAVLSLIALAAWFAYRNAASPMPDARKVAAADALPASPRDIEAHGEKAKSLLAPDDARARNAAVAFAGGPIDAAQPFVFRGTDDDRARALDCLATAALYEAGDDTTGEAAVAQVVLNRVRHAAFPATVCGVVYQGSQRATGCQFTFTCDGSLARRMPDAAWARARSVASAALSGHVDESVGLATHYHTDWVYPYWSPSLRKLAKVGTHLFFGWPGGWGGPRAFTRTYRGNEVAAGTGMASGPVPAVNGDAAALAASNEPAILGLPMPKAELPAGMGKVPLYGNRLRLIGADGHSFGLLAPAGAAASQLVNAALALCEKPGPCQVSAWRNEDDIPGAFPVPDGARGTMVFEFVRAAAGGKGTLRFDCGQFPNRDPNRCLSPRTQLDDVLPGVRFKSN